MDSKGLKNAEIEMPPMPLDLTANKAGRFISVSMMLHISLVAIVGLMHVPPIEFPQKEIVEFEVESETTAALPIPDGSNVPESKGAAAPAPAPVRSLPSASVFKMAAPAPVAAAAATIDDISTPDLETADAGDVAIAQMDEADLQDDFDKVDHENSKALATIQKSLDDEAEQAAKDSDEALKQVNEDLQAKAKALADAAEARRKSDQAAIAAAEAKERAAADKAAKIAALKEAHGKGTGDAGEGTGDSGSPAPTKEVAGIPGGVRSLEQLRQRPGNKFPEYSSEERLARQEGLAMFYAYVNKDGSLSQFKLGKSTGYRNLDGKTLAALKKWKFYPGQEGWVEMPFKWALSGEAMEAGGQLRK